MVDLPFAVMEDEEMSAKTVVGHAFAHTDAVKLNAKNAVVLIFARMVNTRDTVLIVTDLAFAHMENRKRSANPVLGRPSVVTTR